MDSLSLCVFLFLFGQIRPGYGGLLDISPNILKEGYGGLLDISPNMLNEERCYPKTSSSLNYRTQPETGLWKFCLQTVVGTGFTETPITEIRWNPIGDCASTCTSLPGCMTFAINQYGRCFTTRWCPGYFDINYSVYEMNNVTERCFPAEYLPASPVLGRGNTRPR